MSRLFKWFVDTMQGKTELVSGHKWSLTQVGEKVRFYCDREDNFTIVSDEGTIDISDGESFDLEYLQQINATLHQFSLSEYSFGDPDTTASFVFRLTEDQFSELDNITVGHQEIPLTGDSVDLTEGEISADVTEYSETYCISLSGFYPYTTSGINILFDTGYPEVSDMKFNSEDTCTYADLTDIARREYTVSLPDKSISGFVHLSIDDVQIETIADVAGRHTLSGTISLNLFRSDLEFWNTAELTVRLEPDEFGPIEKTQEVSSHTTFDFHTTELNQLSSVTLTYPEWVVEIDAEIQYESLVTTRSKYNAKTQVSETTLKFTNVIPNTDFSIYHSTPMFTFEDPSITNLSIKPNSDPSLCVPVVVDSNTSVRVTVDNSIEECKVNFGQDSVTITDTDVEHISLSGGSAPIRVQSPSGDVLFEQQLDRHQLAPLTEMHVTDSGVKLYKSKEPVRYLSNYTYK